MLTVTPQAARLIHDLVEHARLHEAAGLRLAQRDDHTALAMTLEASPHDVDVVLDEGDAHLFLAPQAAVRTQGQSLDASTSDSGSVFFLRD